MAGPPVPMTACNNMLFPILYEIINQLMPRVGVATGSVGLGMGPIAKLDSGLRRWKNGSKRCLDA